jgi:hypothetical protein
MKMRLKVILTATSIAALASPIMAQSTPHAHAARSAASISTAYGSAARTHAGVVNERSQRRIDDCVRVAFPSAAAEIDRP